MPCKGRDTTASYGPWVIAEGYGQDFPAGFWGHLLASEVKLKGVVGAGRLDRVWDIDQAAIDRIEARFALNMNGVGIYLWDLKTIRGC